MKQGWTYKKLGEVCEVISGQSPEGKYYNSEGKGTPFYQGKKDFTSKYIGKPTVWTTEETKIAEKDDLLMSVRAPVGDVNFATQRLCIGRGLAAIRSKDNLNKEYLFYFLLAIKDNIKGKEGVGFASINRKEIMDIDLKYPTSLPEQQRIVSRLDSAFAHIDELKANAEKQVNEARALFQKALSKAMEPKDGWEEKTLGEVCDITRGKRFVRTDIVEKGIPCIHYGDIYTHYGLSVKKTRGCITPELAKKMRFAKKNDVVVVQAGENNWDIGVGIAYLGEEPAAVHDACFILRHKQNPMYISYYLRSNGYHRYLVDYVHEGKICSFLKPALENAPFSVPPLAEQQRIVERLDSLSKNVKALEENQRKVMAECDALKQALLRKVFE